METTTADIWDETYKRDHVRGLPNIAIMTVISEGDHRHDHRAPRRLIARMGIVAHDAGIHLDVDIDMSPTQMRALAAALTAAASRCDHVLTPLLQAPPKTIPIALYREPEAA